MELLYIWIDKYRTFEKQGFNFSGKFDVKYEDGKIDITKNEEFINIYPKHITGISGLFGKNAVGKTSILDLIGMMIEARFTNNEMTEKKEKDPHIKSSYGQRAKQEKKKYVASYFLIYYYGVNGDGEDIFVFETNNSKQYIELFANSSKVTEDVSGRGKDIDYFDGKGWLPFVFTKMGSELILKNNTHKYNDGIIEDVSIILFKKRFKNLKGIDYYKNGEEVRISLKRRNIVLKSNYMFKKIVFLVSQMKTNCSGLYRNSEYILYIDMNDVYTYMLDEKEPNYFDIDKTIKEYNSFDIGGFTENQKTVVEFVYKYLIYAFYSIIYSRGKFDEKQRTYITDIKDVEMEGNSYENIKDYYHKIMEYVFRYLGNEKVSLDEFIRIEKAIENILEKKTELGINIKYNENRFSIAFNKESKIDEMEDFFIFFVDESEHKDDEEGISIMQNFIESRIDNLSEGEFENLSIYAALDEQININMLEKKKYILLLDEIEQSMHPEMCRQLISNLILYLKSYKNKEFQIILSSHSPFVVSDIPCENVVYLQREGEQSIVTKPKINTFGANIHTLLKDSFFMDSTIGGFAESRIKTILEVVNAEYKSKQFAVDILKKNLDIQLQEAEVCDYIEKIISSIGEDIIRNHLQKKYETWKEAALTKEEKKKIYQVQVEELQQKITELGEEDE